MRGGGRGGYPEAEFLDESHTKVLRVFLLAVQSHLYSFALRFIFLQTHATSYSFYCALVYTVKEKGGKPNRIPHSFSYCLGTSLRSLKSENYAQKPQRNCTFMNSPSALENQIYSFFNVSNMYPQFIKNANLNIN